MKQALSRKQIADVLSEFRFWRWHARNMAMLLDGEDAARAYVGLADGYANSIYRIREQLRKARHGKA